MARTVRVLFRRDPAKDRRDDHVEFEGYQLYWPDGRPVAVGLDAFCRHGQRLFGLGRYMANCSERLLDLVCFPLSSREDRLTRLPGLRVRRFMLKREGRQGRVHFVDGTPTAAVFEIGRDEKRVLDWIGLSSLREGGEQWFDLTARAVEPVPVAGTVIPVRRTRVSQRMAAGY